MSTGNPATPPLDLADLRRDLAMVSPALAAASPAPPAALGAQAVQGVVDAIRQSRAPAIVGLNALSIEACRHAVAAAEAMRGRLLPWPLAPRGGADAMSVMQTGSLGHLFASELIVWVGCNGGDGPIAEAIAAHQLLGALVKADLATVLQARQALAADPGAAPIGRYKRVGVVLAPGIDGRVASQWHKLAAQVQTTTRVAVFALPDLTTAINHRGALEVITWQTGLSCASGGVSFADGVPRPCVDAQTLLDRNSIDLVIDTTVPPSMLTGNVPCHVVLGPTRVLAEATAVSGQSLRADRVLHVPIPGLAPGVAARVMRCDGVILWTCNDPAVAQTDGAAGFLAALTQSLRRSA